MTNTLHSSSQESSKHPISLDSFLSTEESKLLDLVAMSSLTEEKKYILEYIIIPSVKDNVEKVLK